MEIAGLKDLLNDKLKLFNLIVIFAIGLFAYVLIVGFDIGIAQKNSNRIQVLGENLATVRELVQQKDYAKKFNPKFSVERGANWLIETIDNTAAKEGVTIDLVRPMEIRILSGYKNIGVMAEGRGAYYDIVRFLADLENSEKHIAIEEFTLTAEKNPGQTQTKGAVFKLIATCFMPEK